MRRSSVEATCLATHSRLHGPPLIGYRPRGPMRQVQTARSAASHRAFSGRGLNCPVRNENGRPGGAIPAEGAQPGPRTQKRPDATHPHRACKNTPGSDRGSALHLAEPSPAKAKGYENAPVAHFPRRVIPQRQSKGPMRSSHIGPRTILPAVTYSPTQLPMQYHRR